ncbi:MAG TPA: hypothetical protein VIL16_20835 [Trebonia sp.]
MGFIKDTKVGSAVTDAARAIQEGRTVFLYRFNVPASNSSFSGPVSGAAEVIEGIERRGWRLAEMAYDGKQSTNGAVMLLFRLPPPMPAPEPPVHPQRQMEQQAPQWQTPPQWQGR